MQTEELHKILKEFWGYDSFRPLQLDIIQQVLLGKDVLALLPTGGGKSICFQIPALYKEGICIVVSPLIALIKDQVYQLTKRGISAAGIFSGIGFNEINEVLQNAINGRLKFLYVSPERLKTKLFLEFLPGMEVNMVAIDEAHCISQWGYDFRPSYLEIANLRKELNDDVSMLALTASATDHVQKDIVEKLEFNNGFEVFKQSFARKNLSYSVLFPEAKEAKLIDIFKKVAGCGIVYCKSRKLTQHISSLLSHSGISSDYYHAGLSASEREKKQDEWIQNRTRIIVCTNAFGMGIDKPDVRTVVHFNIPDSLEHYYQEAGRAGRDGKKSYAVLLTEEFELKELKESIAIKYPDSEELKSIYSSLMNSLGVAAGEGENVEFQFDISSFASNFKVNILKVVQSIKIFEQEGLMQFSESVIRPSKLKFTAGRNDLERIESEQPMLDYLVKGLLRNYQGILNYDCVIYETALAKMLKTPIENIFKDLNHLHNIGIVDYQPAPNKPTIELLADRMFEHDIKFNNQRILLLKKRAEERLNAMIHYAQDPKKCRSIIISNYFGENDAQKCGICDNCIAERQRMESSSKEMKAIFQAIEQNIFESISLDELFKTLQSFPRDQVWKAIQFLQDEKCISINDENIIVKLKSNI